MVVSVVPEGGLLQHKLAVLANPNCLPHSKGFTPNHLHSFGAERLCDTLRKRQQVPKPVLKPECTGDWRGDALMDWAQLIACVTTGQSI